MSYPTVPARSGIFTYHTHDTHAYPGISRFQYLPYRLDQVFSKAIPTIPTIPRYFRMTIPTVPARSGIFRYHTHGTHAYPGISRFRYLPYRLDQVFSDAIPTIPTHTPVWHTPVNTGGAPGIYRAKCTFHGAATALNHRNSGNMSE